jgi:hypothetical protein
MADYAVLAEIVKALIIAKHFLETDLEKLRAAVSTGYPPSRVIVRIGTTRVPMDVCSQG